MHSPTQTKAFLRLEKPIWGIFITLLLSAIVIVTFWGHALKNPNTTFFKASGDGLKDYYTSSYFIKHDSSYWHSNAMNYPYGEHVAFTGNQLVISHAIKLISHNIVDISDYTVGIINMCMLASLLLGSLLLFLLLKHFKLPTLYSAIVAIGITFLSPQIARMAGHFSLSYTFAIPLVLYLMAKFHEKPRWQISCFLGLFMLWAFGTHMYMIGFYAFIVLLYWLAVVFILKNINLRNGLKHLAIQFILPFLIISVTVFLTDHIADRTTEPWGFLVYVANLKSIFLPIGRPYARILHKLPWLVSAEWEGIAFIGIVATVGTLFLMLKFFKQLTKRNFAETLWPSSNPDILNVFLWTSVISLLYSFGLPFKLGLHFLVDFIGPLKQMRGIARFSWIFFYVINLYVFIWLWKVKSLPNWLKTSVIAIALVALLYDAYYNTSFWSKRTGTAISPYVAKLVDAEDGNRWLTTIDSKEFQAVLPLPYFHIGSENIWLDDKDGIAEASYLVSWLTGLPNMGVMMSRTSISQTFSSLQLAWEPYAQPDIISHLVPDKDILVVSTGINSQIPKSQRDIINKSTILYQCDDLALYSLPIDSLKHLYTNLYAKYLSDYNSASLFEHGTYESSELKRTFLVDSTDSQDNEQCLFEGGCLTQSFRVRKSIYQFQTPCKEEDTEYLLSFWVKNIHKDKLPRSQLILKIANSDGEEYFYDATSLFRLIKVVDNNWGLIEVPFTARSQNDIVGFFLRSYDLRRENYTIAHIMVRETNTDVYKLTDNWLMKNNRFYSE